MKLLKRSTLILIALFALLTAGTTWLVSTQSGARFLLQRSDAFLPAELSVSGLSGTLTAGLQIDEIVWTQPGLDASLRSIFVHIELMPLFKGNLNVEQLLVGSVDVVSGETPRSDEPAGPLSIDLPVDIRIVSARISAFSIEVDGQRRLIDQVAFRASLVGPKLSIPAFTLDSDWLTVSLDGSLQLRPDYAASLDANWTLAGDPELAGVLELKGDLDEYRLDHRLQSPVVVSTRGVVAVEGGKPRINLVNGWEALQWTLSERQLFSPEGELLVAGFLEELSVGLQARVQIDELPMTTISVSGSTDLQSLAYDQVELDSQLGSLVASGRVAWSPTITFNSDYALSDVDPSMFYAGVSGAISIDGDAKGSIDGGRIDVDAAIARVGGELNGFPLSGNGRISARDSSISVQDLDLAAGSNRLQANGRIGESLSLEAQLTAGDLGEVLPGAAGRTEASVRLSGRRDAPVAIASLSASGLAWNDITLETANGSVDLKANGRLLLDLSLATLVAGGQKIDGSDIRIDGTLDDHEVMASVSAYGSELNVSASGGWPGEVWLGTLERLSVDNPVMGRWSNIGSVALSLSPQAVSLSRVCMAGGDIGGRACLAGNYGPGGVANVNALIDALPIAALPVPWPADVSGEGLAFVDASVTLSGGTWSGSSTLEIRDAILRALVDDETYETGFPVFTAKADLDNNGLESTLAIEADEKQAFVNLELGIDNIMSGSSPIVGEGSIRVDDASVFASFAPDLSNPSGRIEGSMSIAGRMDAPALLGEIRLLDGSVSIRRAGITVTDINIALSQDAPASLALTGSARSGDGVLTIDGKTLLAGDTGLKTDLTISGENFELLRMPDWQASASPNIRIAVDERLTAITGELAIPTANIAIKELPESATKPSSDAVVHRDDDADEERSTRRVTLDLKTTLGDEVRLSAFGLKTGLSGSVQLRGGTRQAFLGFGRVTLVEGTYKAYGQDLSIERGNLIFNGPLDNPQLDIRASRDIGDITAGISVTGTPSALRSEVYSDPPMRDVEALAYLLTGRPLTSAASSDGARLENAAFALGLSGAGSITSSVRNQLGLDSLMIEGGAEDGRIVAGKRLSDRLLVEYGYGLFDKLGSLLLRYQINERLVIESRTGSVSNVDLVYRVRKQ